MIVEQKKPLFVLGAVADTHIPDQVSSLHPGLVDGLRVAGVQVILHAGDISLPKALEPLQAVAPVLAARGNRDLAFLGRLPLVQQQEYAGVTVAVMHGHGGPFSYLVDKAQYYLKGYVLERYLSVLIRSAPGADVIVFGHTHRPECFRQDGRLLMNPGPAVGNRFALPSFGVIRVYADGEVTGEIVTLQGYRRAGRHWAADDD